MDPRRLPLNAVRAFEAAARHLSLSRAAAELGVTPGAVGHQLRLLEAHLGAALFRKAGTGVALTEAGQRALPKVQEAFATLAGAFAGLPADAALRQVTVALDASFAASWLVPRLEDFTARHPLVDVHVVGPLAPEDYAAGNVDLGISYRTRQGRGLLARPLLAEAMLAVCSPALLAGRGGVATVEDLLRLPLLHIDRGPGDQVYPRWTDWLGPAGVEAARYRRGPSFSLSLMAVRAALDGQGVALVSATLVRQELAAGRLVALDVGLPPLSIQRYLLTRRGRGDRPAVRAFVRWLLKAAESAEP